MIHYNVHPVDPQIRILEIVADILTKKNGICIYPTDTVYGMGACIKNPKAIDKIGTIIKKDKKRLFSFICSDFSQVSEYVKVNNYNFKLMKHYLPGPYTFILPATNYVPKKVSPKRRTVGIRIPDCKVITSLIKIIGQPMANTSLSVSTDKRGDPGMFEDDIKDQVDVILDIGKLDDPFGSTIVDLTDNIPVLIREGKGKWYG
jgi:tRNA threonylcarbamoyl adenosine modification protein (Sua5/YciO/YrdC/YwlC family)